MPEPARRRSPVHHLLEARATRWGQLADAPVALQFGVADEASAVPVLALCDLSVLPKLGVKGSGAEAWLRDQEIDVPAAIYDTRTLADGGLIVRLGAGDFFLEAGVSGDFFSCLLMGLSRPQTGVYRVERQDATFLLSGARAVEVLAQLCSIDFRAAPPRCLIMTRAGGVNSAVLPDSIHQAPLFRFWVDPTYAISFWEMLAEIAGELGGQVVGAACFYPELS